MAEDGLNALDRNYSLVEAAHRLGISPYALRRWAVYDHRLPFMRLGRRLIFRQADLAAFEAACLVPARTAGRARP